MFASKFNGAMLGSALGLIMVLSHGVVLGAEKKNCFTWFHDQNEASFQKHMDNLWPFIFVNDIQKTAEDKTHFKSGADLVGKLEAEGDRYVATLVQKSRARCKESNPAVGTVDNASKATCWFGMQFILNRDCELIRIDTIRFKGPKGVGYKDLKESPWVTFWSKRFCEFNEGVPSVSIEELERACGSGWPLNLDVSDESAKRGAAQYRETRGRCEGPGKETATPQKLVLLKNKTDKYCPNQQAPTFFRAGGDDGGH
jgi:hypothetical protein